LKSILKYLKRLKILKFDQSFPFHAWATASKNHIIHTQPQN
jgi:hypothetical protein